MSRAPFTSRPLVMPDARVWSAVFVDVAPWKDSRSSAPAGWSHPWRMPDDSSRAKRKPLADCPIGPFCSFRGLAEHRASFVRARPEVYDAIKRSTIHVAHDSMSFQVIVRGDGTALVTCDHSRIIGGVWIALIDASSIPAQVET